MNELSLFDTLFNDGCAGFPVFKTSANYVPKVDVKENKNAYVLDMDLPGFSENDVQIDLKENVLTISSVEEKENGNKKPEDEFVWLIHERRSSDFERRFSLPQDIDADGITASFKNGVLTVSIPRKAEAAAKKINISVA
ncbi:MAG: Hsp20/alpha crystallin family protein [Treponema sp.]|nr:Hsp20/alpha crystallin family protein [Treponema sp.]MBQ4236354.1 Hsp20/alpha crystallin family protein [Treponema sp.]